MNPLDIFRLDGKAAIVTGASSGLGARFARVLSAAGADLMLVARREDRLAQLAEELRQTGSNVAIYRADVSVPEQCEGAAKASATAFGRVDILVNNAGVGQAGSALREDPQVFESVIRINLMGVYWMARACVPYMPNGSTIINVASILGQVASRFPQAGYVASKAGVLGLTRDLAQQWSERRGIRVNALCPGYFDSEITGAKGAELLQSMVAETAILKRFGRPEELDGALLYLASSASSYMTGSSLVVDGGISATL